MKTITIRLEDKDFKKLCNAKEEAKIIDNEVNNWEEFILKKCLK